MSLAAARALAAHGARLAGTTLAGLLADDPARATDFVARLGPLSLHYPRQHLDRAAREALLGLAREADLAGAFRRLVDGEIVNATEGRPALHTALRSDVGTGARARALRAEALAARERMRALGAALRAGPVTDVVHVGIGGSDLGPRLVVDALAHVADGRFRAHFLSNVDGHAVARLLGSLDPARTAAVLVSKSFTTQETLLNGRAVADWLGDRARLHAVSASPARAVAFGVPEAHVLPMWDAIGGRFSLWSAVGFTIALALGDAVFDELLAGAAELDAHALAAPCADNLPVLHGLIAHWNRRVLGRPTVAVLPYDQRLALLPAYLQQLMMESLGKSTVRPRRWSGAGSAATSSTASSRCCTRERTSCPASSSACCGRIMAMARTIARCSRISSRNPRRSRAARTPRIRRAAIRAIDRRRCCCSMP
jgi:glucose-6-phosphate isomerase